MPGEARRRRQRQQAETEPVATALPETTGVSPEPGEAAPATESPASQPPRPVRPGGPATNGVAEIDPSVRAAVEQIMAEQRAAAAEPPVEDPPDHLVVRQERVERASTGRGTMIPMTEEWIRLPAPYGSMLLLMWVDFPRQLARQVDSREEKEILRAARRIVLGHNSWEDEDGILPHPGTDEFWERLAPRILVHVIRCIIRVMVKLPNSPRPTPTKP